MARTFKQYGCAHDTSGSLNVVVSIGGNEVFNGAVSADTDPHTEDVLPENELFSFELDEAVSGDTAWSVTVTGTDDGTTMCLGPLKSNKTGRPNMVIPLEYFMEQLQAQELDLSVPFPAEKQAYIDSQLGDRVSADIREKLQAGTSVPMDDATPVMLANQLEGEDPDWFGPVAKTLSNGQLNGEAYDITPEGCWPVLHNDDTLTMTANLTVEVFEYNPPLGE